MPQRVPARGAEGAGGRQREALDNFDVFMQIQVAIFNFISCGPLLSSWCQNEPTLISGELVATSVVCRRQRCIDAQLVSVQSFLKILAERRNEQF